MLGQRRERWVAGSQRGVLPQPEQEFVLHSTDQFECEQQMKETVAWLHSFEWSLQCIHFLQRAGEQCLSRI